MNRFLAYLSTIKCELPKARVEPATFALRMRPIQAMLSHLTVADTRVE